MVSQVETSVQYLAFYYNYYSNNIQQDVNVGPCNSSFSQKESTVELLI